MEHLVVKTSPIVQDGMATKSTDSNVVRLHVGSLSSEQSVHLISAVASEQNRQAFARLFEHYAPRLKAMSLKQGLPPSKAEELVQETMLMVWRKAESFDQRRGSPSAWIFTILRNKRIDMYRKQRHPEYELNEALDVADPQAGADEIVDETQRARMIRSAIELLPGNQRQIIDMAFFEDKSHGEIADELSLPLGTVKSRIRLAVKKLKDTMDETV
jgi:RNA polymerase sigma-70 factor (ECF subfamily)